MFKRENTKKTELLSPVGSAESLYSAVNNGCDAVYLGGKNFSARKYASNFSNEELEKIIDFCHLRGVKVLITLNILYKESEINDVLDFVSKIYYFGADAIIIQDIGLFDIIKKHFPDIRLHASTQMTIHNKYGVGFLSELGYDRVVLSRELSISEIKNISSETDIEIECFVHGALCVSYSGRCLMSSIIGERSGNRGQCAQPCRLSYKLIKNNRQIAEGFLLSPKDICTAEHISELINAGVDTFKIEGRMKSPEYVAEVTSIYRKYIDFVYENNIQNKKINIEHTDKQEITQIFNRGGSFSDGYLYNWAGTDMISASPKSSGIKIGMVVSYDKKTGRTVINLTSPVMCGDGIEIWTKSGPHTGTNISKAAAKGDILTVFVEGKVSSGDFVYKSFDKQLDNKLKREYKDDRRKNVIDAELYAITGKPIKLILKLNEIKTEIIGNVVSVADNRPMSKNEIVERLLKTGNTPFVLNFVNVVCDDNIYIRISELNELRRNAVEDFSEKLKNFYKRKIIDVRYRRNEKKLPDRKFIAVSVNTEEQFAAAVNSTADKIYIEFNNSFISDIGNFIARAKECSKEIYMFTPSILREHLFGEFDDIIKKLDKTNIDGYVVRNYAKINVNKKIIGDFTFNVFNSSSLSSAKKIFSSVAVSPELNISELYDLCESGTEIYAYGRLPLMTTHQCPVGLYAGGKKNGRFCSVCENNNYDSNKENNHDFYFLKDRKNMLFPVIRDCKSCTAIILNSSPIFVLNKYKDIFSVPFETMRLSFTTESHRETTEIIKAYSETMETGQLSESAEELLKRMKETGFTNGHFFRGVL